MIQRFALECELMSQVHHPNIVQFMGVCFLQDSPYPVLVMERLDFSLDKLLQIRPNLPLRLKFHVLHDVTKGIVHLHNMRPSIVHRDLTTCNVLLNKHSLMAKIADLGNARMIEPGKLSKTLSKNPGTQVYMPPESTGMNPVYDSSLDVFSFGHLALYAIIEIFPCNLLPATYHDPKTFNLFARSELERRTEYIELLHSKVGKTHDLVAIIETCLNNVPELRPKSEAIMDGIVKLIKKYEDEFDIIHELGKLELYDELLQGNEVERERKGSFLLAYDSPHPPNIIKPGVPELLDIYTSRGSTLRLTRRQGWKQFNFRITDAALKYSKANKDLGRNCEQSSRNITSVNAVKSTQFSDGTKFYFEVHFTGDGSPWLLRAYTKEKRESWIKTLANRTPYPVTAVHTESYASFDYITARGMQDVYEDIVSAVPDMYEDPVSSRTLPLIPDEDDDGDNNYEQIRDTNLRDVGETSLPSNSNSPPKGCAPACPAGDPLPPEIKIPDEILPNPSYQTVPPEVDQVISPLSYTEAVYEDLTQATRDKISPYAVCYQTPEPLKPELPTLEQPEMLISPSNDTFSPSDITGELSPLEASKSGVTKTSVRLPEDKETKFSQSVSEEYEDMVCGDVAPYDVPGDGDLFDNSNNIMRSGDSGPYSYIANDDGDIQTHKKRAVVVSGSSMSPSSSGSGSIFSRANSTPAYLQAHSFSAGSLHFPPPYFQTGPVLQSSDPNTLQLNILIQMQQMLAQMQATYGQTISSYPPPQTGAQTQKSTMMEKGDSKEHNSLKVKSEKFANDGGTARKIEDDTITSAVKPKTQESVITNEINPGTAEHMKECLRGLLNKTKVVDHYKLLVTDDKSDATEVPEWSRASVTINSMPITNIEDTMEELERNALLISKSSIREKELIPKGRFGEIYYAKLVRQNGTIEVAVKTLKKIKDEKERSDFVREQTVMSKLMHPTLSAFME